MVVSRNPMHATHRAPDGPAAIPGPWGARLAIALFAMAMPPVGGRADIYISEVVADNETGIEDEDETRQDWLELYNSGDAAVNLDGWWLTDKSSNKTQWRIPSVTVPPKAMLFIWASGKNRVNPAEPLHTSFSLSKGGEYLGLYMPHPTTGLPVLVDELAPGFPALPPDVSYGRSFGVAETNLVTTGDIGRFRVLSAAEGGAVYSGTNYAAGDMGHGDARGWNVSPAYNDASWTAAATGIGYDTSGGFAPWIGASPTGNCEGVLRYTNTSLCFRKTIVVPSPSAFSSIALRMKYEDGFVAFVNGTEVGRANCTNALTYDARANVALDEAIVNSWTEFAISNGVVVPGTNVLAVQGLNVTATSSDFLLLPEIVATKKEAPTGTGYLAEPTPGAPNGEPTAGPLLFAATPEDPDVPRPLGNGSSPPLVVTVRVIATKNPVSSVRAYTRTMWGAESAPAPLADDGLAPDAVAGDGIYSAALATTGPAAGEMFRWRFEASDSVGVVTRLPAFASAIDSPEYFGTVALDASTATSQLPILLWFVQGSPTNGPTLAAFRGSCYYLNRFYDNTGHEIHGQSTAGFPKKSYDFDFNANHRFLWKEGETRVKDINLLSNYADKTKARNTVAHWTGMMAGTPHHFAYPVRVHLNGVFHGVMDMVEDGDDRMLERNGLDPAGALYKIYSTNFVTMVEKKTRKEEDNSDLQSLYDSLDTAVALTNRQTFAYDNIDIPATINYLATRSLNSDGDHGAKNYYLYRESDGSGEWQPIIWDVDLSYGHNFGGTNGGYFNDSLVTNNALDRGYNRFYAVVYDSPEMRQMYVRRMRTLMDALMQPPGTANGILETQLRSIAASVDPDPADPSPWTDGDLDAARWGFHTNFVANRPREEVERVIGGYIEPRRSFLFNTGAGRPLFRTVPLPNTRQTNAPGMVVFDSVDFNPASGTQAHEYVILRNTTTSAVDVSGWRIEGEIEHVIRPGTVIPPGNGTAGAFYQGLLHLAKDARAFRMRPSGPGGGQRRLVQGDYEGQLSARGGDLGLRDDSGMPIATFSYSGSPVPAQRWLRITEIQYHPADPTPEEAAAIIGVKDDDFEYLELVNTGSGELTLTGAYFSQGIEFTFPAATLGAGQRLIVAKNPAAFAQRYPSAGVPVFGPYWGQLDNGGERLELTDVSGENILDFEYKDGWYPATDGSGRSLVLRETSTSYDAFGNAVKWAISGDALGSPGISDAHWAQAYRGWDNFHFSESEREDPLVSGPYADPDGDGRPNWTEYALGCDPWVRDMPPMGFAFAEVAGARHAGVRFCRAAWALDVTYGLLATQDLAALPWEAVGAIDHGISPLAGDREILTLRETAAMGGPRRFLRLHLTFQE